MNEETEHPYIAFLRITPSETSEPVTDERLEYSFHTFSLRNEKAYAPTGDVTFASPNPDSSFLEGGVERLIKAVLVVDATAVVLGSPALRQLLDSQPETQEFDLGHDISRTRADLEALYVQSQQTHDHRH